MTLSEIRTKLRTSIGNPPTAQVADATLDGHINDAYRNIASRQRFEKVRVRRSLATVRAQSTYNLASDEIIVFSIWNKTTNRRLKRVDSPQLYQVDGTVSYPTDYSEPLMWYRDGNTVQLFKTPDAVYSLEYTAKIRPATLVSGTDVPIIPDNWHEGIAYLARWYYFDSISDYPKAQYAMNTYKLWLQDKDSEIADESQAFEESVDVFPSSELDRRQYIVGDDW